MICMWLAIMGALDRVLLHIVYVLNEIPGTTQTWVRLLEPNVACTCMLGQRRTSRDIELSSFYINRCISLLQCFFLHAGNCYFGSRGQATVLSLSLLVSFVCLSRYHPRQAGKLKAFQVQTRPESETIRYRFYTSRYRIN